VFARRPSVVALASGGQVAEHGPIAVLTPNVAQPLARRALVLLTRAAGDDEVRKVANALDDAGMEHVWLSHPMDWTAARGDLAWAPAGRDGRGRDVVVVDGLGVYRAEQFMRVFARGDSRVTAAAIKARMAERVTRLRTS
jgi:hypothetical protein